MKLFAGTTAMWLLSRVTAVAAQDPPPQTVFDLNGFGVLNIILSAGSLYLVIKLACPKCGAPRTA